MNGCFLWFASFWAFFSCGVALIPSLPLQAPRWAGGTGVWVEVSVSDVCSGINLGALLLIKRARGHIGTQVNLHTYSSLVRCFYCHRAITSAAACPLTEVLCVCCTRRCSSPLCSRLVLVLNEHRSCHSPICATVSSPGSRWCRVTKTLR